MDGACGNAGDVDVAGMRLLDACGNVDGDGVPDNAVRPLGGNVVGGNTSSDCGSVPGEAPATRGCEGRHVGTDVGNAGADGRRGRRRSTATYAATRAGHSAAPRRQPTRRRGDRQHGSGGGGDGSGDGNDGDAQDGGHKMRPPSSPRPGPCDSTRRKRIRASRRPPQQQLRPPVWPWPRPALLWPRASSCAASKGCAGSRT